MEKEEIMTLIEKVKKEKLDLMNEKNKVEQKLQELNQIQLKLNQQKEQVIAKLIGIEESIKTLDKLLEEETKDNNG